MITSLQWRLLLWLALAAALAGVGKWAVGALEDRGYQRAKAEDREAAEAQRERNRELQRAAELRYVVKTDTQVRFITQTIKEIPHVTTHLAACPLGEPAVRLLNAAAACARGDRPAACDSETGLPDAR